MVTKEVVIHMMDKGFAVAATGLVFPNACPPISHRLLLVKKERDKLVVE